MQKFKDNCISYVHYRLMNHLVFPQVQDGQEHVQEAEDHRHRRVRRGGLGAQTGYKNTLRHENFA